MTKYETCSIHIVYKNTQSRDIAIVEICDDAGRHGWQPFSVDYEKEIVFFTRKVNPDRKDIKNYA